MVYVKEIWKPITMNQNNCFSIWWCRNNELKAELSLQYFFFLPLAENKNSDTEKIWEHGHMASQTMDVAAINLKH